MPPFPPKNDVLGCRGVTYVRSEGEPRPRQTLATGHTAPALPRLSNALRQTGRPGVADRAEVPSRGREQHPPIPSPIIPSPLARSASVPGERIGGWDYW